MRLLLHQFRIASRAGLPVAIGRGLALLLLLIAAPFAAGLWLFGARLRRTPRLGRHGALVMEQTLVNRAGAPVPILHPIPP